MFISETTIRMQQEHNQDLRREAEQERLIQDAGLRPANAWGLSWSLRELRRGKLLARWAGLGSSGRSSNLLKRSTDCEAHR